MTQAQEIKCPYCSKEVFFPMDVRAGYCSSCGRIVDVTGEMGVKTGSRADGSPVTENASCELCILYSKRPLSSYNTAVEVQIDGPVSKSLIASTDKPEIVRLPRGTYRVAAKCYYQGGVNSQYVYGVIDITLKGYGTLGISNGSSIFNCSLKMNYK